VAANATQSMFNPLDRCTYFEIDSDHVGDRFAISISLPATYDLTDDPLPVLYVTDGNIAAPMTGGVAFSVFLREAAIPCRPFIQVNIGYPEDGARRMLSTRNRDLVPPGERVVFGLYETMLAAGAEAHPAHLHLSINIHEMEGPVRAYRKLATGALRFLDQAMADPLPGLRISSEMIPGQDHEAGFIDAYRSFVRHTYRRG